MEPDKIHQGSYLLIEVVKCVFIDIFFFLVQPLKRLSSRSLTKKIAFVIQNHLTHKQTTLNVDENDSIRNVKENLQKVYEVSPDLMRLFLHGHEIHDEVVIKHLALVGEDSTKKELEDT